MFNSNYLKKSKSSFFSVKSNHKVQEFLILVLKEQMSRNAFIVKHCYKYTVSEITY